MKIKKNLVALFLFFIFAFNLAGSVFALNSSDALQQNQSINMAFGDNEELSVLSDQELESTEGEWWVAIRWVITRVVIPIIIEQCSSDENSDNE
tara:strand:+ start:3796 stop:4077 length:282 start_codon:yes stop_codon:yes gene_type:complete